VLNHLEWFCETLKIIPRSRNSTQDKVLVLSSDGLGRFRSGPNPTQTHLVVGSGLRRVRAKPNPNPSLVLSKVNCFISQVYFDYLNPAFIPISITFLNYLDLRRQLLLLIKVLLCTDELADLPPVFDEHLKPIMVCL